MTHSHSTRCALALALTIGMLSVAGAVSAQTPPAPAPTAAAGSGVGYAEVTAQSAFGNVTSQAFGVEAGVTVRPDLQVFASFGRVRDAATTELGAAAQTVALALTQVQTGAVSFSVKEPVTFLVGGVRYHIPSTSILKPYVSGGVGIAKVSKDVTFLIGGADASSSLAQYVTVGSDISGDESKLMFTLGGGVVWPAWRQLIVDFQFQYGRIATDTAITVSRAGIGLGVRF